MTEALLARCYRLVLLAYPGSFRRRYGADMDDLFLREYRSARARGWFRGLWTAVSGLLDALRQGALARLGHDPLRPATSQRLGRSTRAARWRAMLPAQVRGALRVLTRRPGFAAAVVVPLALGIAANATMFGVADRLLFRPPAHVEDPTSLRRVYLEVAYPDGRVSAGSNSNLPVVRDVRNAPGVAGASGYYHTNISYGRGPSSAQLRGSIVTNDFFRTLGTRPALGRFFVPDDASTPVAVLGHGFWARRFAADPEILGSDIALGSAVYTVIGVAPKGFTGLGLEGIDVWLTLDAAGDEHAFPGWNEPILNRLSYWLDVFMRIEPEASTEAVEQHATQVLRHGLEQALREGDPRQGREASLRLRPVTMSSEPAERRNARTAVWLLGVSAVVLLVCIANVTNLMLTRALERRRETAVRLVLGIPERHLVGHFVAEGLLLAGIAAGLGVVIANAAGRIIEAMLLPGVELGGQLVDGRVLAFTALITGVVGVLTALAPAFQVRRAGISEALKAAGHLAGPGGTRLRQGLAVAQAGLSVLLLVGAGVFVASLHNARSVDMGMDTDEVVVATLGWLRTGLTPTEAHVLYRDVAEALPRDPAVSSAAITTIIPLLSARGADVVVPGRGKIDAQESPYWVGVSADFFETTGLGLVQGRVFLPEEVTGDAPVVIVNEALAQAGWPGGGVLGDCIQLNNEETCREVVGVVRSTKRHPAETNAQMQAYIPLAPAGRFHAVSLVVRGPNPDFVVPAVRDAFYRAAPNLSYVDVRSLQAHLDNNYRAWTLGATMFTIFGVVTLAVAAVGLYAVLAFGIAQRRHEIGVRMALGAAPGQVVGMVLRQSLVATLVGVSLGAAAAAVLGRFMQDQLFGVAPAEPTILAVVAGVMLTVALLAGLVPSRRAVKVDPVTALRAE